MGASGRWAAWGVVAGLALACAPKAPPQAASDPEPLTLRGTWWLLDDHGGPARARLVFDDEAMRIVAPGAKDDPDAPAWSLHPDDGGWEAIGPDGAVVRLDDRADGSLLFYAADGRMGLAWPVATDRFPVRGTWVVTDPEGQRPDRRYLALPGGGITESVVWVDEDKARHDLWFLEGPGDGWVVVMEGATGTAVRHLHALPGEAFLMWGERPGRALLLHRPGDAPAWGG